MKRRHFIQTAATTLATLGVSQLDLQYQSLRYARVLAQPTHRKKALLVGINDYPFSDRFNNLYGCANDAEMQRQLLIHRFGFHPNNIMVLSDDTEKKPTRDNILGAFEDHLIKDTKPGDVVVYHFSGHGSRVIDPNPIHSDDLNSTFVPRDVDGDARTVDDIMGRTMFLLMSALDTENVTVVLDSCYAGGGTRGNIRIRAADRGQIFRVSDRELDYQEKWLSKLETSQGISRDEFLKLREIGVAKGVVIASALRDQTAADVTFGNDQHKFNAGAFTYLMTQFLWQQTASLSSTITRVSSDIRKLSGQIPLIDTQVARSQIDSSMYFVPDNEQPAPADAVVTTASESEATIWLGGIHPDVLETMDRGSTLAVGDGSPLEITERQGLFAKVATPEVSLSPSTTLRETARIIPKDLTLTIGIDPSLAANADQIAERINGWPHMAAVKPQSDGLYGTEVHLILSKMTAAYRQQLPQHPNPPAIDTIVLFDQALTRWIPGTFYSATTSMQSILNDLYPKLRTHLAARFMQVSLNADSSQLAVQATVKALEPQQEVNAASSGRSTSASFAIRQTPTIEVNRKLQITVTNQDTVPLYAAVVGIRPSGDFIILLPTNVSSTVVLTPGQKTFIPAPTDTYDLVLDIPGFYSIMVFASRKPFTRTLKGLDAIASGTRVRSEIDPNEDLSGLNGLLEGFDTPRSEQDDQATITLSTNDMATLAMGIEAVES